MSSDEYQAQDLVPAAQSPELTGLPRQSDRVGPNVDGTRAVINQADALMRRHRVFVAGATALADDMPVLTEVVESPGLVTKFSATDLVLIQEHQQTALSSGIRKWAETELTAGIHALVDELTEKLVATLTASAKTELLERLKKELDGSRQR